MMGKFILLRFGDYFHLSKIFVVKKMPRILAHSGTPDEIF